MQAPTLPTWYVLSCIYFFRTAASCSTKNLFARGVYLNNFLLAQDTTGHSDGIGDFAKILLIIDFLESY